MTYPGVKTEVFLMNVRMVNCTFEDRKRPDFNAEANTRIVYAKVNELMAP